MNENMKFLRKMLPKLERASYPLKAMRLELEAVLHRENPRTAAIIEAFGNNRGD